MERPDWIRSTIDSAVAGAANGTPADRQSSPQHRRVSTASKRWWNNSGSDRALSDSLNQELNQRLKEAHAISDRFQLALPAAGETGRSWWRFWQTSSPAQSG